MENVFFVVWSSVSMRATLRLLGEVRDAAAKNGGPLVYLALIPDGSPAPDEDGRRALSEVTKLLLPHCSSMHCVIEGVGFRKSMIRGAATSIFMLSGQRGKMQVHDTVEDALRSAPDVKGDPLTILSQARRRGLL